MAAIAKVESALQTPALSKNSAEGNKYCYFNGVRSDPAERRAARFKTVRAAPPDCFILQGFSGYLLADFCESLSEFVGLIPTT